MSTATAAPGPVPLSRVWSGAKVLAEDLVGEDLADVLDLHAGANAWWVLDRSTEYAHDELRRLAKALDLDDLAVADMTAKDHRAKFEQIGTARLVVTNSVAPPSRSEALTIYPISMLITDRALVILADLQSGLDPARLLSNNEARLARHGLEAALQLVLSAVIDSYRAVVDGLEEASDQLADVLFEERSFSRGEQLDAFRLRKVLSELRRLTEPMRSVMIDVRDSVVDGGSMSREWSLLEEKHARVANAADSLRDALASMFETSLALADVQLNTIMKKLTGWAAILAVPTLVTSFVGMNVQFPGIGTAAGFWLYLVIMICASIVIWIFFRRRDWV